MREDVGKSEGGGRVGTCHVHAQALVPNPNLGELPKRAGCTNTPAWIYKVHLSEQLLVVSPDKGKQFQT